MLSSFLGLQYRKDCAFKQAQRADRIRALPAAYHGALTADDRALLGLPVEQLVRQVQAGAVQPQTVLQTYGKAALRAQEQTNCVTEVMMTAAEEWLAASSSSGDAASGSINLAGPLAGMPVSLKDTIVVGGFDASVGYSSFTQQVQAADGAAVRLLKDAGAVPFVKTNLPITLLSFESTNAIWGRTTNPHNARYSPGGSSGGEGALLALGGSRIGVGSDVAGSVRLPAAWSGCYSLRCSTGRWPKLGFRTSMPGQEGVPSVYSPMARTLADLTYFTRAVVQMQPWKYDYSVHPLPWKPDVEQAVAAPDKLLRVGILTTDGVVDPSPACRRALDSVADALRTAGHDVVLIRDSPATSTDTDKSADESAHVPMPPNMEHALNIAAQLLNADGCRTFEVARRPHEWLDSGASQMRRLAALPAPLRYLYYLWVRFVRRDPVWARLVRSWGPKSAFENWQLVAQREAYRDSWFHWWDSAELDILITPPNATPALPHDAMHDAVSSCGYTFLFNLLDYTTGILPVTHVDRTKDQLPADFSLRKLNGVAQGAMKHYDADAMHGLPVAVQVVGRRLEEEKVLAAMKRVEDALGDSRYKLLELE
ncbi:amidase protein [Grosmannia clavigera kw1407]|uniref:amidase n=1 Tax=Grosmannia clavigera (strain kw1407 / UAMH 11150) TaxID=655863 RepID=F0XDH3_GROCL|nr:amidase protein [Grosmannia clavigera kw1407]EFX04588.1 amidase protein [Grosmannia clavigera kw1407]